MSKINVNGILRDATPEEQAKIDALKAEYINDAPNRKLAEIRKIR